jgi:CHAD domain-containing protein
MVSATPTPLQAPTAALSGTSTAPSDARAELPLTPDSPMISLAYRCLAGDYRTLLERQPQRGVAPSADDVHQIRIATRRLRVALRLFAAMLPPRSAQRLAKELRWLARGLSDVRDLDVHNKTLRSHIRKTSADDNEALGGYALALQRERVAAREKLHELFASERYTRLIASLGKLVDGAPSTGALRRWRKFTIRDGAAKYLRRSRKRVMKLGRKVDDKTGADELHRLRIRAKRLRYALEFFAEAYPELLPVAKATKALQDVLGEHQDARTARRRVLAYARTLRADAEPATAEARVAALVDWRHAQTRRARQARHDLQARWQQFREALQTAELTAHRS